MIFFQSLRGPTPDGCTKNQRRFKALGGNRYGAFFREKGRYSAAGELVLGATPKKVLKFWSKLKKNYTAKNQFLFLIGVMYVH